MYVHVYKMHMHLIHANECTQIHTKTGTHHTDRQTPQSTSSPRAFSPLEHKAESDSASRKVEAGNIGNISIIDTQI